MFVGLLKQLMGSECVGGLGKNPNFLIEGLKIEFYFKQKEQFDHFC